MYESVKDQEETLRWAVLATRLNGAADARTHDHIDTAVIMRHVQSGDVFEFLSQELGPDVDYAIRRLTDVQRHTLLQQWQFMATGYEPSQFHIRQSGLALLVAYLLHLIQNRHAQIPT